MILFSVGCGPPPQTLTHTQRERIRSDWEKVVRTLIYYGEEGSMRAFSTYLSIYTIVVLQLLYKKHILAT